MARRVKYPKLKNGFGNIRYLGKGRRKPYGVYPPSKELDIKGRYRYPAALAYVRTWNEGFSVLMLWHAGKWTSESRPIELLPNDVDKSALDSIVDRIMDKLEVVTSHRSGLTFIEVANRFWDYKYNGKKKYSLSTEVANNTALRNLRSLHDKVFVDLRLYDLQKAVDDCHLRHSSKSQMTTLIKQIYKYAEMFEIVEKDYSRHLSVNMEDDTESGEPFAVEEIKTLWEHQENEIAEMLLIMIYSGFRIGEYIDLETNYEELYFKGGIKTKAGKNRIVPIHSAILPLVQKRLKRNNGKFFTYTPTKFRIDLKRFLSDVGISYHTPHDTRHTFSMLCDMFDVKENDKKRLLGHAFSDVTNKIYGHRGIESLRKEIEKIIMF